MPVKYPKIILRIGNLSFIREEVLARPAILSGNFTSNLTVEPRQNNLPCISVLGDELLKPKLSLRFSSNYTNKQEGDHNPLDKLFALNQMRIRSETPRVSLGKWDIGNFLIKDIRFDITQISDLGDIMSIDVKLDLLQAASIQTNPS